ncbi:MAG TPA: EmrB/QacA family drug resistance transporter, partial [Burkholderiales bacterium]
LQMDKYPVIWSGFIQGLGTGFVYVPLASVTFATLDTHFRNEGTALFSLVRNIGSSIGISAVTALLTRNTQVMHSRLAESITPFSDALRNQMPDALSSVSGLSALNAQVSGQAAMIAYNNDFKLMLLLTMLAVPLVALLRGAKPKTAASADEEPMVME